jgi:hypothetical protein
MGIQAEGLTLTLRQPCTLDHTLQNGTETP